MHLSLARVACGLSKFAFLLGVVASTQAARVTCPGIGRVWYMTGVVGLLPPSSSRLGPWSSHKRPVDAEAKSLSRKDAFVVMRALLFLPPVCVTRRCLSASGSCFKAWRCKFEHNVILIKKQCVKPCLFYEFELGRPDVP